MAALTSALPVSPFPQDATPQQVAHQLVALGSPVLRIEGLLHSVPWHRNRRDTGHIGRYALRYRLHGDEARGNALWKQLGACVYFALDDTGVIRHVGKSDNRFADRWRLSPAFDAQHRPLGQKHLYHSTCIDIVGQVFLQPKPRNAWFDVVVVHESRIPAALTAPALRSTHPLVLKERAKQKEEAGAVPTPALRVSVLEAWLRTARTSTFLDWNAQ